ncbi:hypothetical protein SARC_10789 [Sphaeroforma arctica JP610]|uniref:Tectonic domain-containing protein n=1 Tax=Sphaeroforma arctica JP610 TaxID=667725 RepID=A0A0L0FJS9_9EUKA|nr:hypothetical protein SARC_10789 [Sphaeroforma arctica JP610]KNC76726.1 hypothetical protein SARC_10789 [Sphaeroforma arctica JP610]|eukprot:XP_014150628.1 hypothetical protein SARC_10789 [Sphaeroforma arctica JP610]
MNYFPTLLVAGAAILGSTSAVCTEAGASLTLNTIAGEKCLCDSLFSDATCSTQVASVVYDECTDITGSVDNPNDVSLTQDHTTLDTLVNDESVRWTVNWPAGLNRVFTSFTVGTCASGANLEAFTQTSEDSGCTDRMVFEMKITSLRALCGFDYNLSDDVDEMDVRYADYSSNIIFEYTEPTDVGGDSVTRSGQVTIPTSILVLSRVAATTAEVKVFSPFSIDTALTAQAINEGASASYLTLTYALSTPYSVLTMNPVLANVGTNNAAFLCTEDVGAGTCGDSNNGGAYIDMPDCVEGDYTMNNNGCNKDAYIQLVHGDCTLDGTYTISDVVIDCYKTLAEADCPINQQNRDTTIEFTLASDNFCGANADLVVIENAVAVDRFIFVDPENRAKDATTWTVTDPITSVDTTKPAGNTPIAALEYDEFAYARVDFSGLAVTKVTIVQSQARESAGPGAWSDTTADTSLALGENYPQITGTLTPGTDYTSTRADPAAYEIGLTCTELGLCAASQTYLVQYKIHEAVHAMFANPGLGNSAGFDLRLLVDVSYETDGASATRRRRRRQASTDTGNTGVQPASDPAQDGQGPASISASSSVSGNKQVASTEGDNSAAGAFASSSFVMVAVGVVSMALNF